MTKHLKLYIAVFLVSMLFSVTAIIAYADTQQSTTLTYTSLSPEEKNHYEVQIPSSVELNNNGGSMKLSISDGYELEDDYQVEISVTSDNWTPYKVTSGMSTWTDLKYNLFLDGSSSSSYYMTLTLTTSSGSTIKPQTKILTFRNTGIYEPETSDGTINFTRSGGTDRDYKQAGTFTNTLVFNITGSYF